MGSETCLVCFDDNKGPQAPAMHPGCACRGGSVHVECAAKTSLARLESVTKYKGAVEFTEVGEAWMACAICKQAYTGPFALLLAQRFVEWAAECGMETVHATALMHRAAALFHAARYDASEEDARHARRLYKLPAFGIEAHMAACMIKRGNVGEALAIQTDLVHRARAEYGEKDPIFLRMAYNLALSRSAMGHDAGTEQSPGAESLLSLVYDTQKSELGQGHEATLLTGEALGNVLVRLRKHREAAELLRHVASATRRLLGDGSRRTRTGMSLLGTALFHTEKHVESEEVYRALCTAHETQSPVNGPELTQARIGLIQAIAGQGRLGESLALVEGWGFDLDNLDGPFAPVIAVIRAAQTQRDPRSGGPTSGPSVAHGPSHTGLSGLSDTIDPRIARCDGAGCTRPPSSLCVRCRSARYCSKECQRGDWKRHKPLCHASQSEPTKRNEAQ